MRHSSKIAAIVILLAACGFAWRRWISPPPVLETRRTPPASAARTAKEAGEPRREALRNPYPSASPAPHGADIWGTVKSVSDSAVAGATVHLFGALERTGRTRLPSDPEAEWHASARTGEDGSFRILAPHAQGTSAPQRILVEHPQYCLYRAEIDRRSALFPLAIVLAPGSSIYGRVVGAGGQGAAGMVLVPEPTHLAAAPLAARLDAAEMDAKDRNAGAYSAVTDAGGNFTFGSLHLLPYDLLVFGPSGRLLRRASGVPAGTRDVVIELEAAGEVTGRVVGPDDRPVIAASLSLYARPPPGEGEAGSLLRVLRKLQGETAAAASSGAEGTFRLAWIPPGDYLLRIEAKGFYFRILKVAAPTDLKDVILERGLAVSGRVVDEGRQPLPGARVWLVPDRLAFSVVEKPQRSPSSLAASSTASASDGSFVLALREPGPHFLAACQSGYAPTALIEVADPDEPQELVVPQGVPLQGRVLDEESGLPLEGARVTFDGVHDETKPDGVFAIPGVLPPSFKGSALFLDDAVVEHPECHSTIVGKVTVEAGQPLFAEVRLKRWKTISGRVVDREGSPVANARIEVAEPGAHQALVRRFFTTGPRDGIAYSGLEGELTLRWDDLAYGLWVAHPDHTTLKLASISEAIAGDGTLRLTLDKGLRLSGRVRDQGDAPVAGAVVTLARARSIPAPVQRFLSRRHRDLVPTFHDESRTAVTAEDGGYRFLHLEPDREYLVAVRRLGMGPCERAIQPAGHGDLELDLVLPPAAGVRGEVRGPSGPIVNASVAIFTPETAEAGGSPLLRTQTDNGGRFLGEGLPASALSVEVRAAGYETEAASFEPQAAGGDLLLSLKPLPVLLGSVREHDTGEPVTAFDVELQVGTLSEHRKNGDCQPHQTRPSSVELEAGLFVYENLCPDAAYRLTVRAPGYCPAFQEAQLPSGAVQELEVGLVRGARVLHVVRDRGGAPVEGAKALAGGGPRGFSPGAGEPPATDSLGLASMGPLPLGNYRFEMVHAEHAAAVLDVEITREDKTIEWRLEPGGSLAGRIFARKDQAGGMATLTLDRVAPSEQEEEGEGARAKAHLTLKLTFDPDKAAAGLPYAFPSLSPGTYQLHVTLWGPARAAERTRETLFLGEMNVAAGSAIQRDFTLP